MGVFAKITLTMVTLLIVKDTLAFSDCPEECKPANFCTELKQYTPTPENKKIVLANVCINNTVCCSLVVKQLRNLHLNNHRNQHLIDFSNSAESCGETGGQRIVGGEKAALGEFPWMAILNYNDDPNRPEFRCGGSLINRNYVLTAAHCVYPEEPKYVRLGEYNTLAKEDCVIINKRKVCAEPVQDIAIAQKIIYSGYTSTKLQDDIALLRLSTAASYNKYVQPICLPITSNLLSHHIDLRPGTVTGWGIFDKEDHVPNILQKVELTIYSEATCKKSYPSLSNEILSKTFCAGGMNKASCSGDSGGPLIKEALYPSHKSTQGVLKFVQYGVVATGPLACGINYPEFYTDVREFMTWILDNIEA